MNCSVDLTAKYTPVTAVDILDNDPITKLMQQDDYMIITGLLNLIGLEGSPPKLPVPIKQPRTAKLFSRLTC